MYKMNTLTQKLSQEIEILPPSMQQEVLQFVAFLKLKASESAEPSVGESEPFEVLGCHKLNALDKRDLTHLFERLPPSLP
jgi:hypothetical protein